MHHSKVWLTAHVLLLSATLGWTARRAQNSIIDCVADTARGIYLVTTQPGAPASRAVRTTLGTFTAPGPISLREPGRHLVVDERGAELALSVTDLPVLSLLVGEAIPDEPKVPARLTFLEPGARPRALVLGIELRGDSTLYKPKRSYDLELWRSADGEENLKVRLAGLRTDNDWVLDALYNEPLRVRSFAAFALWSAIASVPHHAAAPLAQPGPRTEPIELFVNGDYRGIYGLVEPIDRKQLRLRQEDDPKGTGSLFMSADYTPTTALKRALPFDNASDEWAGFEWKYPRDGIDWQPLHGFASDVSILVGPHSLTASSVPSSRRIWSTTTCSSASCSQPIT